MSEEQLLTPNDVARLLLVSPVTVRQWAQKGLIESQATPGGHRRFTCQAVNAFAAARGLALVAESQQGSGPGQEPLRILIVEDDAQLRSFLVELFASREQSVNVEVAVSGFEAGSKVRGFAPDIVLLDLMLPGIDGIEVCRQLKADVSTCAIRVVAMTGYYSTENVNQILAAGAEVCLRKPLDIAQVLAVCGID